MTISVDLGRKATKPTNQPILEKKDYQENTQKIQILMFGIIQTLHFRLRDIIHPLAPRVLTSYADILCKI